MKLLYFICFNICLIPNLLGQSFFIERFEYPDYETFKTLSENRKRWTFFHSENQDFNNNRMIDLWENIKSIDFPSLENGNKAIHFQLKRMDSLILRNDVMRDGKIDDESIDYHSFFTHINRNEIATWDDPNLTSYLPNRNYEFQYSVMVPENFEFETTHCSQPSKVNYELSGQWHFSYSILKGNTMAPLSLRIVCNRWMLNLNPNNNKEEKDEDFIDLGEIQKGKWENWKFQIRFSHKNKGHIHVYKNDELVYSAVKTKTIYTKKTMDGSKPTVYFKIGLYKPHWWSRNTNVNKREIYFDDVKISK